MCIVRLEMGGVQADDRISDKYPIPHSNSCEKKIKCQNVYVLYQNTYVTKLWGITRTSAPHHP